MRGKQPLSQDSHLRIYPTRICHSRSTAATATCTIPGGNPACRELPTPAKSICKSFQRMPSGAHVCWGWQGWKFNEELNNWKVSSSFRLSSIWIQKTPEGLKHETIPGKKHQKPWRYMIFSCNHEVKRKHCHQYLIIFNESTRMSHFP